MKIDQQFLRFSSSLSTMLCFLFLSFSVSLYGVGSEDVLSAIREFEQTSLDDWSYEFEETKEKKTHRGIYFPVINGQGKITLYTIDGREPTEQEREKFERKHSPREPSNGKNNERIATMMITPGSLIFETSENGLSTFGFIPQLSFNGPPKPVKAMVGSLVYDESGKFMRHIEIHSTKPFKAQRGIKIKHMKLRLEFDRLPDGTLVPLSNYMQVSAKAFFVVNFTEEETTYFKNYLKKESEPNTD